MCGRVSQCRLEAAIPITAQIKAASRLPLFASAARYVSHSANEMHSAAIAYNLYSERIFFAGRNGADDATEQPFNSLDFSYSFHPTEKLSVKLRLQNLLDQDTVIEQGGVDVLEQNAGQTAKVDFSYRF